MAGMEVGLGGDGEGGVDGRWDAFDKEVDVVVVVVVVG